MENNQQSFWQFSDQLRHQTNNLANISLNDSIWSSSYVSKRPEERRNFETSLGGAQLPSLNSSSNNNFNADFNGFNGGWKIAGSTDVNNFLNDDWKYTASSGIGSIGLNSALNGGFNKGIYSKPSFNQNYNNNSINNNNNNVNLMANTKPNRNGKGEDDYPPPHNGGKNVKKNKNTNNNKEKDDGKSAIDKRFKTLPPSEALPRNETVGGYIFVCNNDTMQENLKRQLFGLPPRYRDSVRQIIPGLPIFLYNYSNHQLHGIFEAASFGGSNIDPSAWEDKKNPGESRFPAQVRVVTRKICEPLEEDSFRPVLHHYDGPKFRLELNIPETLSLLDIFEEDKS
ncbi:B2 protein-like [Impatiens glandulifera]|uniref:B2 protein-like n=1 Tax=Impatiens glandulifera TaxID=253017 RepID=UPI001FB099AF|nr:B2 protein-like [Impatiens glandulifera]